MQQSYLTHTRRQLRQMHQMGDSFEIAEAQGALDQALDQLLQMTRNAVDIEDNQLAADTEEDFSHGGTEATNYEGGGGYLKRAWDRLKSQLLRSKKAKSKIPQDMRKADGEVAQTAAESRQAWRAHGEKLGQYDPSDPAYEAEFARQ